MRDDGTGHDEGCRRVVVWIGDRLGFDSGGDDDNDEGGGRRYIYWGKESKEYSTVPSGGDER
jgi:hypothetical protein